MSIYKFRVMYDEDENIYREVEIRPGNSFMELEEVLINSWGLPPENTGKFWVSNDRGQRLRTFNHKKPVKTGESAYYPMILNFVEDPHQVFIYDTVGKQELSFILELVVIGIEKPEKNYPYLVKSYGPSPVKKEDIYKHIAANSVKDDEVEGIDEEDESKLLKEFGSEGEDDVEVQNVFKEAKGEESEAEEAVEEEEAEEADEFADSDADEEGEGEEPFGSGFSEGSFDEE